MQLIENLPFHLERVNSITCEASQPRLCESASVPAQPHDPALIRACTADDSLRLQTVLQLVQELLIVSTGATGVAIALGDTQYMQCVASIGDAPSRNITLQLDGTLSGHCVRTGQVLTFQRGIEDAAMYVGPQAAVLAPVFQNGAVVGLMGIFSGESHAFGAESITAIRYAATMLGFSMARIDQGCTYDGVKDIGWEESPAMFSSANACGPALLMSAAKPVGKTTAVRRLLGLPCSTCGSYLLSDERVCGVCRSPVQ